MNWSVRTVAEPHNAAAGHFDAAHAADYERNSHVALAGYEACHELAACMLVASVSPGESNRILIGGAGGTAQEIINLARLEPEWRFVGIDPSQPMLDAARDRLEQVGLSVGAGKNAAPGSCYRIDLRLGTVPDLPADERFDGAMLIGVLHHVPGEDAKAATLKGIADRLKPGGALVLAGNFLSFADQPLMLKAMSERWRMYGDTREEVDQKLARAQEHSLPTESEDALSALLADAGFDQPLRFFSSLFWGAWVAGRKH